jgi:hypothetical protein
LECAEWLAAEVAIFLLWHVAPFAWALLRRRGGE